VARRFSISVPLPPYARPRNEWRRRVHGAVLDVQTRRGVGYRESDQLEVRISLPLGDRPLDIHEIDERVKDVIDALEGRIAGPRSRRRIAPIVPSVGSDPAHRPREGAAPDPAARAWGACDLPLPRAPPRLGL